MKLIPLGHLMALSIFLWKLARFVLCYNIEICRNYAFIGQKADNYLLQRIEYRLKPQNIA